MRVGPPTGKTKLRPISRVLYPAGLRGLGVALGFGVAVLVGGGGPVWVGGGGGGAPRGAFADRSAPTIGVPAGAPPVSSVSVTTSPAPAWLATTVPPSNLN